MVVLVALVPPRCFKGDALAGFSRLVRLVCVVVNPTAGVILSMTVLCACCRPSRRHRGKYQNTAARHVAIIMDGNRRYGRARYQDALKVGKAVEGWQGGMSRDRAQPSSGSAFFLVLTDFTICVLLLRPFLC